ncbi:hypothetical protein EVAR_9573_1 [Eumeta japonica]|uniref:Uncharacterized protein n=1 Tax=Eumeta variegata TaxID=151549 RepID=A0A4C1TM37_EUMVA|nr:hypothetical protein EVAR_9573_1 [Eumeta japonica]
MNDDELILRRKKQNADRVRAYRKRNKDLGAMPSTSTVQSGYNSRDGFIVTKSVSDDGISEKSRDALKYYRHEYSSSNSISFCPKSLLTQYNKLSFIIDTRLGDNANHTLLACAVSHDGGARARRTCAGILNDFACRLVDPILCTCCVSSDENA